MSNGFSTVFVIVNIIGKKTNQFVTVSIPNESIHCVRAGVVLLRQVLQLSGNIFCPRDIPKSLVFMKGFAQHRHDQQGHGTANESGDQLGPAEGGRQRGEHGLLQVARSQKRFREHIAD